MAELLIQMQINRSNAQAGGAGATVAASALVSLMVTLEGAPVTDLGATVGNGTAVVSLPVGISWLDGFNVRPGGCGTSITQFVNQGNGIYDIRIVPFVGNPACHWLSGEYVFAALIHISRTIAGSPVTLQGGALGKLIIP